MSTFTALVNDNYQVDLFLTTNIRDYEGYHNNSNSNNNSSYYQRQYNSNNSSNNSNNSYMNHLVEQLFVAIGENEKLERVVQYCAVFLRISFHRQQVYISSLRYSIAEL